MCISRELLATLRVVVARGPVETSAVALAQAAALGAPLLNARNEEAALGALSATLRSRLAKGKQTTVATDQEQILAAHASSCQGDASHYRTALALTARLETKQVLLAVLPVLDNAMMVLRTNPNAYSPPCDVN